MTRLTIPRRRKILYAITACMLGVGLCFVALLGLDIYLHHRVQYQAGVNIWGYRGDVAGKKKPGEIRIVVLGGSTAFGYGLPWDEAWPYYLERNLNANGEGNPPVSVVNLGVPADTALTFVTTLRDYEYLNYDLAILYEGYNDLGLDGPRFKGLTNPDIPHYLLWRYQSPVFRWTGYFPIFPLVLNEKAMALLHGGNLKAAYGTDKIVFRPNVARRTTAAALKTASELGMAIEKRFGGISSPTNTPAVSGDAECGRWSQYCTAIANAVQHVITRGKRVAVITQPYLSDLHVEQQTAMAAMLARRFGHDRRVRYINLGRAIDIRDTSLVYDRIHLVARANQMIANQLTATVLGLTN